MRSTSPMPDNRWPHDMIITVEDRPRALLELLWVREAHALDPVGEDLPPVLLDPPASATSSLDPGTRARWSAKWGSLWAQAASHAATDRDPEVFDRALDPNVATGEREILLRQLAGPSWADMFGSDVFEDPSYREWQERILSGHPSNRPTSLEDSPEHRDVDSVAAAWRRGLTKVISVPCRGRYSRPVGDHGLLLTDETRGDIDAYRIALSSFA